MIPQGGTMFMGDMRSSPCSFDTRGQKERSGRPWQYPADTRVMSFFEPRRIGVSAYAYDFHA